MGRAVNLRRIGHRRNLSSLVAFFIFLQPVLAAVLSRVVLGEAITTPVVAGAAMIFAGVVLAIRLR